MKKLLNNWIFLGLLFSGFLINRAIPQVGITNSGMTQEQERNQAGKGFDYGSKSGSALQQLENMTGQKVNTTNSNSQRYSQQTVSKPTLSFDQQMNVMVTGMIAQSLISSIFSSNNSAPIVQEAKSSPATLMTNTYGENQKVQNALILSKHKKMMDLYKLLKDENGMQYKSITDLSMNIKPYQTQEDLERQKLIKKGVSITWDYNSWAQVSLNSKKFDEPSLNYQRTKADNYLDDAINKIETFPGGTGRIAAVAGRFMVNIKDESMSYLNDAKDAAISGNLSKMEEVGNVNLQSKIVNNSIYKTVKQTGEALVEGSVDDVKGFIGGKANEVNFGVIKSGSLNILEKYKVYSPTSEAWKVSIRKY